MHILVEVTGRRGQAQVYTQIEVKYSMTTREIARYVAEACESKEVQIAWIKIPAHGRSNSCRLDRAKVKELSKTSLTDRGCSTLLSGPDTGSIPAWQHSSKPKRSAPVIHQDPWRCCRPPVELPDSSISDLGQAAEPVTCVDLSSIGGEYVPLSRHVLQHRPDVAELPGDTPERVGSSQRDVFELPNNFPWRYR